MIDDIYESDEALEIGSAPVAGMERDGVEPAPDGGGIAPLAFMQDRNGAAWREIEKYRERKALEKFIKDELYDELDFRSILD